MKALGEGSREQPPRAHRRRGVALLSVLWVLTLLALMAATFMRTTRTEANLARNLVENAKAEALADAGVHLAATRLGQPTAQGGWSLDGRVRSLQLGDGEIRIVIADEAGKIDLNGAKAELLKALFQELGHDGDESASLADAIVDFRDGDHLHLLNGAEDEHYRAAGLTHDAKDAPFDDVTELQQVLGMTPQLYRRIAPVLTVYTSQDQPDDFTAPPLVIAAIRGQSPEGDEADGYEAAPEEAAPLAGGPPDGTDGGDPFGEDGEIAGLFSQLDLYAIHAEGRTASGAVFARDAVIRLSRGPDTAFQTLSWRQGERRLFHSASSKDVGADQESE